MHWIYNLKRGPTCYLSRLVLISTKIPSLDWLSKGKLPLILDTLNFFNSSAPKFVCLIYFLWSSSQSKQCWHTREKILKTVDSFIVAAFCTLFPSVHSFNVDILSSVVISSSSIKWFRKDSSFIALHDRHDLTKMVAPILTEKETWILSTPSPQVFMIISTLCQTAWIMIFLERLMND